MKICPSLSPLCSSRPPPNSQSSTPSSFFVFLYQVFGFDQLFPISKFKFRFPISEVQSRLPTFINLSSLPVTIIPSAGRKTIASTEPSCQRKALRYLWFLMIMIITIHHYHHHFDHCHDDNYDDDDQHLSMPSLRAGRRCVGASALTSSSSSFTVIIPIIISITIIPILIDTCPCQA